MPLILPYKGILPTIHPSAFIAENAVVIGDVHIGAESNVWYNCVIRGDVNTIRIGERTNIQDGTVVHVTRQTGPTVIGSRITVGHMVTLHACTLEDDCFIGMGAIVMDGVQVQSGGMVAAGAMVTYNKTVATGELWAGSPAKFFRPLTQEERDFIPISARNYTTLAAEYKARA